MSTTRCERYYYHSIDLYLTEYPSVQLLTSPLFNNAVSCWGVHSIGEKILQVRKKCFETCLFHGKAADYQPDLWHGPHTYMCSLYLFNFQTSTSILRYLGQILQPVVVRQSEIWGGTWTKCNRGGKNIRTKVKTAASLQCITEIPPGRSAHLLICTSVVYIIAFSFFTMNDRLVKGMLIVENSLPNFLSKQHCICIVCLPSSSGDHDSHWPITAKNIFYLNCKIISRFDSKQSKLH
jgi:hypothetical protein